MKRGRKLGTKIVAKTKIAKTDIDFLLSEIARLQDILCRTLDDYKSDRPINADILREVEKCRKNQ